MRILKFAAAIGAGVIALGVTAYAYFLYSPDPTPPHLSGQVQTATIQVGSRLRSYVEYIPAQLPAGAPLAKEVREAFEVWSKHIHAGKRLGPMVQRQLDN